MPPCAACESSKRLPASGAYSMACVECCARLVLSTRPSREHAAGMLEAIRRHLARTPGISWTTADVASRARQIAAESSDEARRHEADA